MDYRQVLNLNQFLQSNDSPLVKRDVIDNYTYDSDYIPQSKSMKMSKLVVEHFIKSTTVSTSVLDFSIGSAYNWNASISFSNEKRLKPMFAIPFVSAYQGTAISSDWQIYPTMGGSVSYGTFDFVCDYNYQEWQNTVTPDFGGIFVRPAGTASVSGLIAIAWEFIDYVTGEAT